MWKKDEEQTTTTGQATATRQPIRPSSMETSRRAVIGPSISIKGDVTGSEDLLIEGEIDGSVTLGDHAVGVGSEGRVKADIVGRVITVDGHVEGNLHAQEQIVLRGTAKVKGDIKAPRVVLEDGATFRGLVDMGTPSAAKTHGGSTAKESGGAAGASAKAQGDEAATKTNGATVGSASRSSGGSDAKDGASKDTAAKTGGRAASASSK